MTSPMLLVKMDNSKEALSDMVVSDLLENSPKPDITQETESIKEDASHIVGTYNGVLDVLDSNSLQQNPRPDSRVHEPQSNQEKNICLASVEIDSSHIVTQHNSLSNVVTSDGLKKNQSALVVPVKALDDGYNWRKYGQKNVRGNEFIRSYYKCTHPACQVKKQVERSHVGQITDTLYFGKHDHPIVQPISLTEAEPISVSSSLVSFIQEEINIMVEPEPVPESEPDNLFARDESESHIRTSNMLEASENPKPSFVFDNAIVVGHGEPGLDRIGEKVCDDETQEPKRRKQDCYGDDLCHSDKQIGDACLVEGLNDTEKVDKRGGNSRIIVRTTSDVDIVNDGYRWRKYGQKLVKGNPNPRSYYRCSNVGCPVKKHVEREQEDPKVIITTYEGKHQHGMPMSTRIVTPNTNSTSPIEKLPKMGSSEENALAGHEVIVQYSLERESGGEEPAHA